MRRASTGSCRGARLARLGAPVLIALNVMIGTGLGLDARAQERQLLAEEAVAIFPITGEDTLRLEGIEGMVVVEPGPPGELRFVSVPLEGQKTAPPLALWSEGSTLSLEVPKGSATPARRVRVYVPQDFELEARLSRARLVVSRLAQGFQAEGEALDVEGRNLTGSVSLEIKGGSATFEHVNGSLSLRGEGVKGRLAWIRGHLFLGLASSTIEVDAGQDLEAQLEECELKAKDIQGPVRLRARGGRVEVEGFDGGEFRLVGTGLLFLRARGEVDVESDGAIEFRDSQAALHLNSYGGSVRGVGNTGLVEVKTESAEVFLEGIQGPVRVEGEGLRIGLKSMDAELLVYTSGSSVAIEGAKGPVTIENEFGDIDVRECSGELHIKSRDGSVRLLDISGPVQVEGDGGEVIVGWVALNGTRDSMIRNQGGNVTLHLPEGGAYRVEAEARFGRIETELPWVQVHDSGSTAVGSPGRVRQPLVRVESRGDVFLLPLGGHAKEAAVEEEEGS